MDLSKLKVELYDILAVVLPGMLFLCEAWIAFRGWTVFATGIAKIAPSTFTLMLLISFALGPILQEFGDTLIKRMKGPRYFKRGRDKLWRSGTGDQVRHLIAHQLGHDIEGVDVAYDFCLTHIQGLFSKRDLFLANSDLARSLIVICCVGVAPLGRIVADLPYGRFGRIASLAAGVFFLGVIATLCWIRMMRFRELSDTPVFHAFLAQSTANAQTRNDRSKS